MIISSARDRIRAGSSGADAVSALAGDFSNASLNQIRSIVDREERIWGTTRAMRNYNRGQFVNTRRLGGCEGEQQNVAIRIVLHFNDAVTGQSTSFGHTVVLQASGRWGDLLDRAIAEVSSEAGRKLYQIPRITSGDLSGDVRYEIAYGDCV